MVDNGNKRNPFINWLRITARAYRQNKFNSEFEKRDPNAVSERYKEFLHNDD